MLKWFPKLLNDIYLSEEYYGENVLHMGCVAEDASLVKVVFMLSFIHWLISTSNYASRFPLSGCWMKALISTDVAMGISSVRTTRSGTGVTRWSTSTWTFLSIQTTWASSPGASIP